MGTKERGEKGCDVAVAEGRKRKGVCGWWVQKKSKEKEGKRKKKEKEKEKNDKRKDKGGHVSSIDSTNLNTKPEN